MSINEKLTASEVLRQYAEGRKDFRETNLRGQSFKGKDLSGADFSEADIQSTNFTDATLRGAKFCGAKAGLQKQWIIFLSLTSTLLSGLAGFCCGSTFYWVGIILNPRIRVNPSLAPTYSSIIASLLVLVLLVVFLITVLRWGIQVSFSSIAIVLAVAIAIVVSILVAVVIPIEIRTPIPVPILLQILSTAPSIVPIAAVAAFTIEGIVLFMIALASASIVALAGKIASILTFAGSFAGAFALVFVVSTLFSEPQGEVIILIPEFLKEITILFTIGLTCFGVYLSNRALRGDKQDAWIRPIAIAFVATGGTSFYNADLTDADFTGATLKSTDFRGAILTCVLWRDAKRLDHIRPGESYLRNTQLRQLLIIGEGQGKNFERQDLRGLNLSGAKLANASFIDTDLYKANLQDANLSGAILVRTQLERADLTGACLTGACIQDWSVTRSTKLNGVECKYVFMKYIDEDKRDQIPPKREFKDGEFIFFVRSILDTLDLYHEQDVNPKVAVSVLKSLANDFQEPLEIVGLQKKWNGVILQVKTSEWANQTKLKEEYRERYDQSLNLFLKEPHEFYKTIMPQNEAIETKLSEVLVEVKKPRSKNITNIKNLRNEGLFITGGSPQVNIDKSRRQSINTGGGNLDARGSVAFNLGDISGEVTATLHKLPASTDPNQPGIKELLVKLQEAIKNEPSLDKKRKAKALKQIKALAEAATNPTDGGMKELADNATTMLKGIIAGLEPTAALVTICTELLPVITKFFGL